MERVRERGRKFRLIRTWKVLVAVIAGGVLLRAVAIVLIGTSQPTYEYGVLAANLVGGRGYSYFAFLPGHGEVITSSYGHALPSAFEPPGYTMLVAATNYLTPNASHEVLLLQILNLLLFTALALLLFGVASHLMGKWQGIVVVAIASGYPSLIYLSTQPSSANLYLPVEMAMILAVLRLHRNPCIQRAMVAGVLAALVGLLRAEGVFVVLVFGLYLLWLLRRRRGLLSVLAFLVAAALPVGGWLVRNSVAFGQPTFGVTSQSGFVLWTGNHPGATGSGKIITMGARDIAAANLVLDKASTLPPGKDYELRRDHVFEAAALNWMKSHPADAAIGILRKVGLYVWIDKYDPRSSNPIYLAGWVALLVLAGIAVVRSRLKGAELNFLWIYAAISFVMPVLSTVLPRYRLPVDLSLMFPAARTLTELK